MRQVSSLQSLASLVQYQDKYWINFESENNLYADKTFGVVGRFEKNKYGF